MSCNQWPILREVSQAVNALTVDLCPTPYFGCCGYRLRSFGLHWHTALRSDAFWVCLVTCVCVCDVRWCGKVRLRTQHIETDRTSPSLCPASLDFSLSLSLYHISSSPLLPRQAVWVQEGSPFWPSISLVMSSTFGGKDWWDHETAEDREEKESES